jgi:hypothetical protein
MVLQWSPCVSTCVLDSQQCKTVKSKRRWENYVAQFILWAGQYLKEVHVVSTSNDRSERRTAIFKTQRTRTNDSVSRKTDQFFIQSRLFVLQNEKTRSGCVSIQSYGT